MRNRTESFNKILITISVTTFLGVILLSNSAYAENPPFRRDIGYHSSTWLSNEEIVFVKRVGHNKSNYGLNPFTNFIKGFADTPEYRPIRTDYFICAMKTDGTGERIIKQFAMIYGKNEKVVKKVMVEDGKEISVEEAIYPRSVDCSPNKGFIAFSEFVSFGEKGNIYIMKKDGSDLKRIAKGGSPRFSPDGAKILYRILYGREKGLYIMNSDGSNKYKLVDGAIRGIWHPDGQRIFFNYDHIKKDYYIYVINIDGRGKKRFIKESSYLDDWSPDGSRFIAGRSMYTAEGKEIWNDYLGTHSSNPKRYCIPRNARFSPDGTKILGEAIYSPHADIAIISSDFTKAKALRKDESIDISWRDKRRKKR